MRPLNALQIDCIASQQEGITQSGILSCHRVMEGASRLHKARGERAGAAQPGTAGTAQASHPGETIGSGLRIKGRTEWVRRGGEEGVQGGAPYLLRTLVTTTLVNLSCPGAADLSSPFSKVSYPPGPQTFAACFHHSSYPIWRDRSLPPCRRSPQIHGQKQTIRERSLTR